MFPSMMTFDVPLKKIQVWTFSMTTFSLIHTINILDKNLYPFIIKRTAYIPMRLLTLDFTKLLKHQRQRNPRWSMNLTWIMTQIVTLLWKLKERGMSLRKKNINWVIYKSPKLTKYLIILYSMQGTLCLKLSTVNSLNSNRSSSIQKGSL